MIFTHRRMFGEENIANRHINCRLQVEAMEVTCSRLRSVWSVVVELAELAVLGGQNTRQTSSQKMRN
jgi:hypothetical protein